jgi:molybdenum cofactor cytidylyltransferase
MIFRKVDARQPMIDAAHLCLAILAAGRSRRFGNDDKLAAKLHGKMLGLHAADRLSEFAFGRAAVITSCANHPCAAGWRAAGLEIIVNPLADSGMASSVAAAARAAASEPSTQGLLICLADMPYIRPPHIIAIMERFAALEPAAIIASFVGDQSSPPALFGKSHFDRLADLTGDIGARMLLTNADLIKASAGELIDIDTAATLAALNAGPNQAPINPPNVP